jgi:hypothetical protein
VEVARWPRRGLTDTSHPPSSPPDAACASRLGTRDRHWSPTFPVNGITPITILRAPLVSLSTTLLEQRLQRSATPKCHVGQPATAAPADMRSAPHRTAHDQTDEFFAEAPAPPRLVDAHKRQRRLVDCRRTQIGRLETTAVLLWRFEPFSKQ